MKKGQLLSALLTVSIGCVAGTNVAVSATTKAKAVEEERSVQKKAHSPHKKSKSSHKTRTATPARRMTEKDIVECTTLMNKVARTDRIIQQEMAANTGNQLKKSADTQIFATENPGKTTMASPQQPVVQQQTKSPSPISKPPVARSSLPPGTQLFASDDPKAVAHLTGKITVPVPESRTKEPTARLLVAKTAKSNTPMPKPTEATTKLTTPTPHSHSRIELFAPNNSVDLNHLQGKSASLAILQKNAAVDKSATTLKKSRKSIHKTKKTNSNATKTTTPSVEKKLSTPTPTAIEKKP